MPKVARAHLVALSGMIDRAIAFADTGDQALLGAMLAECQDSARLALAASWVKPSPPAIL